MKGNFFLLLWAREWGCGSPVPVLWALVSLVAMLGSTLLAAPSDRVQRLRLIRAVAQSIGGAYERPR